MLETASPTAASRPYVSLVLPAYNEEENLEVAVGEAIPPLEAISPAWEIVIVNDASTDSTAEVAEAIARRHPGHVKVLHFAENRGLGTGMRTGFAHAGGEILIYCDSDLPFEMTALREAHDLLVSERADVVAGFRADREDDSLLRRVYTGAYNALVRVVLGIDANDVNCPLKLVRRQVLEAESLQSNGSFIDAELLARARRGGFRIAQLPVHYTPRVRGTSTLARPSVIVDILREMVLFRLGLLRGKPAPLTSERHPDGPPAAGPAPRNSLPLWVALLAVVLTFVRFGYAYGVSDHDEFIPSVLRLLDGTLFPNDWIVETISSGVNVRTYFLWLIALPSLVLPVWLTTFALWLAAGAAVAYGVHGLAWEVLRDRLAAAVATILALTVTVRFTIGGNALVYEMLVPEGIAWAIVVPGITLFLRGRVVTAGALIGVAAWLQILAALHAAMLLGAVALIEASRGRRSPAEVVRFGAAFVVASLPITIPVAWDQLIAASADPDAPSTFYINALFRNPFHHLLGATPPGQVLRFGLVTVTGVAGGLWLSRRGVLQHGRFLALAGIIAAALILASAYLVEAYPVELVMKLQLQKLTVLMVLGATIPISGAFTALAGRRFREIGLRTLSFRRSGLSIIIAAALSLSFLSTADIALGDRAQPQRHQESSFAALERWARQETDRNALFVIPPTISTFRTHARRSIVANHSAFVFSDADMQTWFERLMAVAPIDPPPTGFGVRPALDSAYHARAPDEWLDLRDRFGADYALVDATRARLPFEPVFESGRWRVYALQEASQAHN